MPTRQRALRKSDWSEEMEARFQSVWKLYPQHSACGEARAEFQRLNPDDELIETIRAALEWQGPVFEARAKRSKIGIRAVPDFRRWLHNYWWEEDELDEYKRPSGEKEASEGCLACGYSSTIHWLKKSGVGPQWVRENEGICEEFRG